MSKKAIITTVSILAVIGVIIAIVLLTNGKKVKASSYQLSEVTLTKISNTVTATGTVEPIKQVEVGTQVSGIISKIYVDYNSEVKAGELIAELDRSVLQQEVDASQATLNSAKAQYDYQKATYERYEGLYNKGLISAESYENYKYNYESSKYSYQQAKANFSKAEKNLGYSWIYSPIDGVVMTRDVDEGQTVASGFSTPTLFTIANDLKKMQVIADVDEADIGEVLVGQKVEFEVDAYSEEKFNGTVTQVRLNATTTSNVVTYEVVIDAPNPELKLKPGLTANVTIYTLDKENVIAVPVRALRFSPENYQGQIPEKCVWMTDKDGSAYPVEVQIGVTDGIFTEITAGLKAGDKVITGVSSFPQSVKNSSDTSASSSNPFMPKRPDQGDNKRTK